MFLSDTGDRTQRGEEGTIVVMFAVCSLLLVLLGIGMTIQRPTEDANAAKLQNAFSVAAAEAILQVENPQAATGIMANAAFGVVDNSYFPGLSGRFSKGIEQLYMWIPKPTNLYRVYDCSDGFCSETSSLAVEEASTQLSIVQRVFDLTGTSTSIDDYYNGVVIYGRITPNNYLGVLPSTEKNQEGVSSVIRKTQLSYILVDPAFSMYTPGASAQPNYDYLFGDALTNNLVNARENGTADAIQWPLAINRGSEFPDVGDGWQYPATVGMFSQTPVDGGVSFTNYEVYHFFASLCFNQPWDYFKGAAVDLLDFLATSSSTSRTTMVGLTGAGPVITVDPASLPDDYCVAPKDVSCPASLETITDAKGDIKQLAAIVNDVDAYPDLIPIFPTVNGNDFELHQTGFPFQTGDGDSLVQIDLNSSQSSAFFGFVNPEDPAEDALWGGSATQTEDDHSAGQNLWELGICRGLVTGSGGTGSPYTLIDDITHKEAEEDSGIKEHLDESMRERSNGASNWVSDSSDDDQVGLLLSQSASGQGESPRNLIAGLAPRVRHLNNIIAEIESFDRGGKDPATWNRPVPPMPAGDFVDSVYGPLATGWRYLPSAIREACDNIKAVGDNYNGADPVYSKERPLEGRARNLIVFGFGFWSPIAAEYVRRTYSGENTLEGAQIEIAKDLKEAVTYCSCTNEIRVIFAMLPMNEFDRSTVIAGQKALQGFKDESIKQCSGNTVDPEEESLCPGVEPRVYTFVVDYQNEMFRGSAEGAATNFFDESVRKVNAAKYFRENMPRAISKMMTEFIYLL